MDRVGPCPVCLTKSFFPYIFPLTMEEVQLEEQQPVSSPLNSSPLSSGQFQRQYSKGSKKTVGLVLLLISLVLIGGAVVYFLSLKKNDNSQKQGTISETPVPIVVEENMESSPTPTITPVVDKKVISIQVLNGTGIVGEAAYLQGKLEDLGYTSVKIGNATKQDYESTVVTFSPDLDPAVVEEITKELEKIYSKIETKKSSSISGDVEIITGLRSGQTPKVSSTSTPKPTVTSTPKATTSSSPTSSL
ncbi:MAG: hypothetical protein KatS3mg088_359 [Patescibacteria group bacterium]|nr:MAG: hypothetical protein KatS3mg088_359 [Patescibacteria group bacterium]